MVKNEDIPVNSAQIKLGGNMGKKKGNPLPEYIENKN